MNLWQQTFADHLSTAQLLEAVILLPFLNV